MQLCGGQADPSGRPGNEDPFGARWIRGKAKASPDHVVSVSLMPAKPEAPPASVPDDTALECQPMRVWMSVLLIPAAATSMSTSPCFGRGTVTSVRWSIVSKPPWPVSTAAVMVLDSEISLGLDVGFAQVR